MARKLEVQIVGDASSLHKAFGKASSSSSKFGNALGKTVRAGALVAGAAVAGLGVAVKVGFKEFQEGQKVAAQTGAVLKSTGGIANVTAKQVDTLATSLMKKSGVDDEAIQSGENMLLTFTKIRNETGKGNDIFKQATEATLDLSVAMGKDMSSSAILVGKALNDPVKGMSALSKAGIQFTKEQKNAITAMVESGNTMGAQKLILKELETQFGGSAEAAGKTFGGQLSILKNTFSNLAGEIVGRFVPHLVNLANTVAPLVIAAMDLIGAGLTRIGQFIGTSVIPKLQALWGVVKDKIIPQITTWAAKLRTDLTPAYNTMSGVAVRAIQNVASATQANKGPLTNTWNNLKGIFSELISLVGKVKVVFLLLNVPIVSTIALMSTRLGPVITTVVIKALEGLTRAIQLVIGAVNKMAGAVSSAFGAVAGAAKSLGRAIVDGIARGITSVPGRIKDAIVNQVTNAYNSAKALIGAKSPSTLFAKGVGEPISQGIAKGITDGTPVVVNALRGVLRSALRSKNFGAVSSIIQSMFGAQQGAVKTPAEQQIATIQRDRTLADLQQAITDAQAAGDAAALARAQQDLQLFHLQEQAEKERAALDAAQLAQQIKLTKTLDGLGKLFDKQHVTVGALMNAVKRILHNLHVPGYASGGIVTRPTLAMVGEKGPEAIIPLGAGGGGVGGRVVHEHHYHGPVVQDKAFLDYLKNLTTKDERRNGRPSFG